MTDTSCLVRWLNSNEQSPGIASKRCWQQEESEHCREWHEAKEIERVLALGSEDLRNEVIAAGDDPDKLIAEVGAVIASAARSFVEKSVKEAGQ